MPKRVYPRHKDQVATYCPHCSAVMDHWNELVTHVRIVHGRIIKH